MRSTILNTIDDLVSNFYYYDRKEDEDLPVGEIQRAVQRGDISFNEIVDRFKTQLMQGL